MSQENYCGHCANAALSANPNAFGDSSIEWVNLLEQGVSAVCPSCGIIYSVAKVISNSSRVSQDVRNAAGFVCGILLLFAGAIYFDKLLSR